MQQSFLLLCISSRSKLQLASTCTSSAWRPVKKILGGCTKNAQQGLKSVQQG